MANLTSVIIEAVHTLTLSQEELSTLRDVLGRVGGCPQKSRRKYSDAIRQATGTNGVPAEDIEKSGAIYFKDLK